MCTASDIVVVFIGSAAVMAAAGTLWKFYRAPRKNHYISKKKPRGTIRLTSFLGVTARDILLLTTECYSILDMQFLLTYFRLINIACPQMDEI